MINIIKFCVCISIFTIYSECVNLDFIGEKVKIKNLKEKLLIKHEFKREYLNYFKTGHRSKRLVETLDSVKLPPEALKKDAVYLKPTVQENVCLMCHSGLETFLEYIRKGQIAELSKLIVSMCVDMEVQPENVCSGFLNSIAKVVAHIFVSRPELTPDIVCSQILQGTGCETTETDYFEWSVDINYENFTKITGPKSMIPASSPSDLVFVQITDTHYDPKYKAGANRKCSEFVCCRSNQGEGNTTDGRAGRWGEYNCDNPWETIENAFNEIKTKHKKIDYIYYTGDTSDHGTWESSLTEVTNSIKRTYNALSESFPNIPLYPIMGNHEIVPVSQFPPEDIVDKEFSPAKTYAFMASVWHWLPPSALETVRIGGYYTLLIRKGFRLVALNNNVCSIYNLWVLYSPSFPKQQLQWLHDVLLEAECNSEKVHILAHNPNDFSCFDTFTREYSRIVSRFWNTISAQFNGHSHKDHFKLFYDSPASTKNAINVAWNGGCITSVDRTNSNYRVYTVDPNTYQVITHDTYIYNLTEANLNAALQSPAWFKEYSFADAYGIKDLSPASLHKLMDKFSRNPELFILYWKHTGKMSDKMLADGCDKDCLANELCEIVTTENNYHFHCKDILIEFRKNF